MGASDRAGSRAPASFEAGFHDVGEVRCVSGDARVYEQGWQSWSPAGVYPALGVSPRAADPNLQTIAFRSGRPPPPAGFQGEGLVAVEPERGGPVVLWSARDPATAVPSIRVQAAPDRLVVAADGEVAERAHPGPLGAALAAWADQVADQVGARPPRPVPPVWCSWYCYWGEVEETDILDNLAAMERLGLPIDVVQVDDGWEAGIGDWLASSSRFGPLGGLASRIADAGRRPGIWVAPFLVGADSRLAADHPDWLVGGATAGRNWDQELHVLDVTHPAAAEHLAGVFRTLVEQGFTYFKLDFLYAGALPGRRHVDASELDAYQEGLRLIRRSVGEQPILLGSGAPLLPSIGALDAMRVSSDVTRPDASGVLGEASVRKAVALGRARSFLHARWWVNDPDCLLVRPEMPHRERWAAHVEACGGLVASSDPLERLDDWGMATLRRLLRPSSTVPVADWDST